MFPSVILRTMIKRISALALPMAISQMINVASGFFCMVMLSKLGSTVLAASAIIYATQMSVMVLGMAILFSLSALISHENGARQFLRVGTFVQQGWLLSICLTLPIIIFFLHITPIELALGQPRALIKIVDDYFQAYSWAVLPCLLSSTNQQLGYAIHQKGLIITISTLSVVVLLAGAYTLIFGHFGATALGVKGLAYAMGAQYTFFFIATCMCFYLFPVFKKYHLFKIRLRAHFNFLKRIIVVGAPIFVQMGGEMLSLFATVTMVGWLGSTALSSYQIVNQFCFLVIIPIFAISQASGILVGQARGSNQLAEIKPLGQASLLVVTIFAIIVAGFFLFFPHRLVHLYIDTDLSQNQVILKLATSIFAVMAFAQISDAVRNVYIGLLRGIFDTVYPMLVGTMTIWFIGMPISYLLGIYLNFGVVGLAYGGLVGITIGAIVMRYRWQRCIRIDSQNKIV